MIDVVFLLLVFFVWTSSFEEPEYDLPGAIATPPGGIAPSDDLDPAEAFDEIVLRIRRVGVERVILFNGQPVALEEMRSRLAAVVDLGANPAVVVDPDDEISIAEAVEVYDAARAEGIDRVLFAAEAKP